MIIHLAQCILTSHVEEPVSEVNSSLMMDCEKSSIRLRRSSLLKATGEMGRRQGFGTGQLSAKAVVTWKILD